MLFAQLFFVRVLLLLLLLLLLLCSAFSIPAQSGPTGVFASVVSIVCFNMLVIAFATVTSAFGCLRSFSCRQIKAKSVLFEVIYLSARFCQPEGV